MLRERSGKLRRPRLGGLQTKILKLLLGEYLRKQRQGEAFSGLSYGSLQAKLYDQVTLGHSQWLLTVYAQLIYSKGQVYEANQLLLLGIRWMAARINGEARNNPIDERPIDVETRLMLAETYEHFDRLETQAWHYDVTVSTHAEDRDLQDSMHRMLLDLAREAATYAGVDSHAYRMSDGFSVLQEQELAAARQALTVQQASLSRALRVLEEHDLIERHEVDLELDLVAWNIGTLPLSEERYVITRLAAQRLEEMNQSSR